MFLGIIFICGMEYRVCVCAASLVGKERCEETKWRYDRVEKAARIIGRARDCVSLAKVMFVVGGNKLWSHREFCVSGAFGERRACLHQCCPEMKWELGAGSGIRHCIDIANFGGDIKLFLCVAYWMYLIHIQLGFLGLRENRRKESIN